jgi:exosome complex protein LRP1
MTHVDQICIAYLRLNGVKAREHPVFKELTRVKQYFGKIKAAEAPSREQPTANLDKQAAARFIKAGLVCALCASFMELC